MTEYPIDRPGEYPTPPPVSRRAKEPTAIALGKQHQWFRVALASIHDGVIAADAQGRVAFLNGVAKSLTGWGREAMGRSLEEVFHVLSEQTGERTEGPLETVLRSGPVYGLGSILVGKDGTERPIEDSAAPIRDDSGNVVGVVVVFRDVTVRRRAEKALAQLAAIVESSEDAIIGGNLDGLIESWNGGAERLFGHTAAEALGKSVSILMPPDRADELPGIIERLRRGEQVEHFQTERLRKDGGRVPVSVRISPIRDAAGRITGASAIARDITKLHRAEAALREANRRMTTILEGISDAFLSCDRSWRLTYINGAAEELLGRCSEELLGRVVWEELPGFLAPFQEGFRQGMAERGPVRFEVFYPPLDAWFECRGYPSPDGLSVFFADITAR